MRKPGKSQTRQHVLEFIHDFVDDRGYAPTVRDIMRGCSLSSTAVVQHHLNILEREGYIHRDPEVFRSIQLLDRKNIVRVPLLGTIAAGEPIPVPSSETWRSEAVETLELSEELTQGKEVYALRVQGFSMIDALIDDGDIVLIQPVSSVNEGDMIVAWLKDEQEVTLKRLFHDTKGIRLQPANSQMKPLYVHPENIAVQGKVTGVIRKL